MKTLLFFVFSLYTLAASLTPAPGKTTTSIFGTVVDSVSGEPLIFANVVLLKNGTLISGVATDLDGRYAFSNVNPGTYDMEASYVGYPSYRQTGVLVFSGKSTQVNFKLALGVPLESVVVSEYKIPLNTTVKTADQIRNLPTKNINAIAATSSGLSGIDGSNVNIRGSRSNATDYYVDGIRVNKSAVRANKQRKSPSPPATPQHVLPSNPVPEYHTEDYGLIEENIFHDPGDAPLSTFAIDVDAASYSNMRRFLNSHQRPPVDAIRIEELINYFDYEYPAPTGDDPVALIAEIGVCPWNEDHLLVHVGLQAKSIPTENLPPSNLVFLIDVSGSMESPDKLPLVIASLELLTETIRDQDRVAIVVYASATGLVLPSTPGSEKQQIITALKSLRAGGSTAGAAGIQLAYQVARENFIREGNNRVILATDGDFNVGISSDAELVRLIEKERESGVFLSVLGFGTGNLQDEKMQQLADKGNGNHSYVDNLGEARKVFVNEFGGTLFTLAKDVKIQVEFNPERVARYRLIGYENRMLAAEDFNDDKKDAGEMGSGHSVTALYEIIPQGVPVTEMASIDELKYQHAKTVRKMAFADEWMTIKFRYKEPDGETSKMVQHVVAGDKTPFGLTSENFRWSAAVASFGMLLRESEFAGDANMEKVSQWAGAAKDSDVQGYKKEFLDMINIAKQYEPVAKN